MTPTPPEPCDAAVRFLAESLLNPAWMDRFARDWWSRWLELQRAIELESSRLAAAERIVAVVERSLGNEPLRALSNKRLHGLIADEIPRELWPTPLSVILQQPDDRSFLLDWIALAQAAGGAWRSDGPRRV